MAVSSRAPRPSSLQTSVLPLLLGCFVLYIGCAGLPKEAITSRPPCPSPANAPSCKILTDSVFVSVVETGEIIQVDLDFQERFTVRRKVAATIPFAWDLVAARDLVVAVSSGERFGGPPGTHRVFSIKVGDSSNQPYSVSAIAPSAEYLPSQPTGTSLSPDARFLYVGTNYISTIYYGPGLAIFGVNPESGGVSELAEGKWLFPGGVYNSRISPDGTLLCTSGSMSGGQSVLTCVRRDPTSGFPVGNIMGLGYSTFDVAFSPDSRYVAFSQGQHDTVSLAMVDQVSGKLLLAAGSPMNTGGSNASWLAFHPGGSFLLVSNYFSADLSIFRVSSEGLLSAVPNSPFPFQPRARITFSPSGRFIVAALNPSQSDSKIAVYAFDLESGSISQMSGSPVNIGGTLQGIVACCTIPQ